MTAQESFAQTLIVAGWLQVQPLVLYRKGRWNIMFDTSNWVELSTETNPRVFDVPIPEERLITWSVSLIHHLLNVDDTIASNDRASA